MLCHVATGGHRLSTSTRQGLDAVIMLGALCVIKVSLCILSLQMTGLLTTGLQVQIGVAR